MRSSAENDVKIVRREEKQARLISLLGEAMAKAVASRDSTAVKISVIARSAESPVITALLHCLTETSDTPFETRVILAKVCSTSDSEPLARLARVRRVGGRSIDDAHEQLVVDTKVAWYGDSMRRDPIKLDAYERIISSDDKAIAWAERTFELIWQRCTASEDTNAASAASATQN
ncbi:MAG: hypothetical protein ACFCUN_02920 [Hyphomicrobiaceae bacterium]